MILKFKYFYFEVMWREILQRQSLFEGCYFHASWYYSHRKCIHFQCEDFYFFVPLHESHKKYVKFQLESQLYEFPCLCFGLGTTAKNLTKFLKILPVIVKQTDVKIICLDIMLLMSLTIDGPKMAGDKLIFVLWLLKTLTYPKTKVKKLISKCKNLIVNGKAILLELTNLISTLCLTAQVVLLALADKISPSLTNPSTDTKPSLPIYKLP